MVPKAQCLPSKLDDGWPESETCDCPVLWKEIDKERKKERMDVKE